jgi:16S rRNA (cytosine1402-N4)-methyltransferase
MVDDAHPVDPHRPIMVAEVLRYLRPVAGDIAVDCTLGGGGHARALLDRIGPSGRLIGLDVDPLELPRTAARLRAAGFGPDRLTMHQANFRDLDAVLAFDGVDRADVVLVDLGVSSMQHDTPSRGFSHKHPGPLDLRMDPTAGVPAWQRLADLDEAGIAAVLTAHADEPHAALIAWLMAERQPRTTHALERLVWLGVTAALPALPKSVVKMSVRRTFQALRILVNDELTSLDVLLGVLPSCLRAGGRVVFLTFHSGEDRRVKKALRAGYRSGIYAAVAEEVVRSARDETFSNRRAASAKLRWAIRGSEEA